MKANPFGCHMSGRPAVSVSSGKLHPCPLAANVLAFLSMAVWLSVPSVISAQTATNSANGTGRAVSNEASVPATVLQSATNQPDVKSSGSTTVHTETNSAARPAKQEDSETLPLDQLKKRAQGGEAAGEYALGWCYANGVGVTQDYSEAVKWYRRAAEQGDARAQERLGFFLHNGYGIQQDDAEAAVWLRKAAEHGNARAQYGLAFLHYYGVGVTQDYDEAAKWLRMAGDSGQDGPLVVLAQELLAECYTSGHGVTQDYAEAAKWYRKAAEQGLDSSQFALAYAYDTGQGVTQDYVEAVRWFRKAAEQGNGKAQFLLGLHYYVGHGVTQDYLEAYKWLNLAAANTGEWGKLDAKGQRLAAEYRNDVAELMTPEQIAEGQRRSSQFTARRQNASAVDHGDQPDVAVTPKGSGTGFFIAGGYVVTSYHVVSDATHIKVMVGGNAREAKLVKVDPANDLALLSTGMTVAELLRASFRYHKRRSNFQSVLRCAARTGQP